MTDKLHKTKGIVLRSVKYGETSLVVTILTEAFGVQSYLVNGVRSSAKKGSSRSAQFQPAAILDLVVYHNELRQLQRIRECHWGVLYTRVLSDVTRHAIAVFMIELLTHALKQPEEQPALFQFMEDVLLQLDQCSDRVAANLPLYFSIHLPVFFGLRMQDNHGTETGVLDLQEGCFVGQSPGHPYYLQGREAEAVAELLRCQHPADLDQLRLFQELRRNLMAAMEDYFRLHIQDFGRLKTLPVLRELLG